ncbi:MAG: M14 family metallopeptidase [Vallitalea sp.]|nr:M14 family metallopeptidase [Vallitalea sp.]
MNNFTDYNIKQIQNILNKLGFYNYSIDGKIGKYTINAIKKFQKKFNLKISGEIDDKTKIKLDKLSHGYVYYTIKKGDTLYNIAEKFKTKTWRILIANNNINPFLLPVGVQIIIPLDFSIVPTNIPYTYDIMKNNIYALSKRYPFMKYESIGKSIDGRELYKIIVGKGSNNVIYNGSHHGNEWITSLLLMKWIEVFLEVYSRKGSIRGYNLEDIFNYATISIVPMVNPDGVELVINGIKNIKTNTDKLIKWNNGNEFSNWKANINGVDLNRNYNAGWKKYKQLEKEWGINGPGPYLYSGSAPESESESRSMANLTRNIVTRLVLAYHSQGEEIFWQYGNLQPDISIKIGKEFAEVSGYNLASESLQQSLAGYKDWFIQDYKKPGYTIEVGKGINPLPIEQFNKIYDDNEELLLIASII